MYNFGWVSLFTFMTAIAQLFPNTRGKNEIGSLLRSCHFRTGILLYDINMTCVDRYLNTYVHFNIYSTKTPLKMNIYRP